MITPNNITTAKVLVKLTSTILGTDYLGDAFSLFVESDQVSRKYKTLLDEGVEKCLVDAFDRGIYFIENKINLKLNDLENGLYGAPLFDNNQFIYKIYNVKANNNLSLKRVSNLSELELDKKSYFTSYPFIMTSKLYDGLDIYYMSNAVFSSYKDDKFSISSSLKFDDQYVLIDKWLMIYAMLYICANQDGLSDVTFYKNMYNKRLNSLESDYLRESQTVDVRYG